MSSDPLLDLAASTAVALFLVAAPGFALLRWARLDSHDSPSVGPALALGYTAVLPLRLLELHTGLPLVLPAAAVSILRIQPCRLRPTRAAVASLLLPLALGVIAFCVCAGDVREEPGGGYEFRVGFDVSDRAIYAMISQELTRSAPPSAQNPLFAGAPLTYSFFPCLFGSLLERYGLASSPDIFLWHLPALAFVMLGFCLDGLLAALGVVSRGHRLLTATLMVLGGDLSWLLDARNFTAQERTSHFLVFHSFAAEALYYNPWMFGLPLTLAGLHLSLRWFRQGEGRALVAAAMVLGGLWETKVFALVPLVAGTLTAGLAFREPRLVALGAAVCVFATPWAVLTVLSGGRGAPVPVAPYLLLPVRYALQTIRGLEAVAAYVSQGGTGSTWVLTTLVPAYLVGCFGVRLVGLGRLMAQVTGDTLGLHRMVATSVAFSVGCGLALVGRPVATDGVQFLALALYVLWLYAGPVLGDLLLCRGSKRLLGALLIVVALAGPTRYLSLKLFPALSTPGSWDQRFIALPGPVVAACAWLRAGTPASDALLMPVLGGPGDLGGLKPLYVALLAERRLATYATDFAVSPVLGNMRRQAAATVYSTASPAEAERAVEALGARWVWEDSALPLAFKSRRFVRRFESPLVSIYEFVPG